MNIIKTRDGRKILSQHSERGAAAQMFFNVPAGKIWQLIGGYAERDVNATFQMQIQDVDNEIIWQNEVIAAGVTNLFLPQAFAENERQTWRNFIIGRDWRVLYQWGVAQTSPEVALWVVES